MNEQHWFSADYITARRRFREAAAELGWTLETFSREGTGPQGEELTTDAAWSPAADPTKALLISSGVHGVEGFFGSAVQLALLRHWQNRGAPPFRCVLLHAVNPYGFAWRRRFDENNVDLNRNFLLPGELFAGAPATYARLDSFLNPRQPPSAWEPFRAKALWLVAQYGTAALRQAVASGQYEFPQGLFYGGAEASSAQLLLEENFPRWLAGSENVVHLDLHTGLGPKGTDKLLIDYALNEKQRRKLATWFGKDSFEESAASKIAYDARGGFGRWCVKKNWAADYLYACAEFGTYGPIQVLGSLRKENQAHHWCKPNDPRTVAAKSRLTELFCPQDPLWRKQVIERARQMADQAISGLLGLPSD